MKPILLFALLSLLIALFCDKTFFQWYISSDKNIVDPFYLSYILIFRFSVMAIGVGLIVALLLKRHIYHNWTIFLTQFNYARLKKMSMEQLEPQIPLAVKIVTSTLLSGVSIFIMYTWFFQKGLLENLTKERGILETLTVIFYFIATCLALLQIRYAGNKRKYTGLQRWWLILAAIFFIFIAMEEINWGELYFQYKIPSIIREANFQSEFSIHNIPLPFERSWANSLLHLSVVGIGLIIPLMVWFFAPLARFLWAIGIPLPTRIGKYGFILAAIIPTDKFARGLFVRANVPTELREFVVSLSFILMIWHLRYYRSYNEINISQNGVPKK